MELRGTAVGSHIGVRVGIGVNTGNGVGGDIKRASMVARAISPARASTVAAMLSSRPTRAAAVVSRSGCLLTGWKQRS